MAPVQEMGCAGTIAAAEVPYPGTSECTGNLAFEAILRERIDRKQEFEPGIGQDIIDVPRRASVALPGEMAVPVKTF